MGVAKVIKNTPLPVKFGCFVYSTSTKKYISQGQFYSNINAKSSLITKTRKKKPSNFIIGMKAWLITEPRPLPVPVEYYG